VPACTVQPQQPTGRSDALACCDAPHSITRSNLQQQQQRQQTLLHALSRVNNPPSSAPTLSTHTHTHTRSSLAIVVSLMPHAQYAKHGLCVTVGRPSVCLSVCLPHRCQQQRRPAGLLLSAGVCTRYRSVAARAPCCRHHAGSVVSRTDGGGSAQTCFTRPERSRLMSAFDC